MPAADAIPDTRSLEQRIDALESMVEIQLRDGNWNFDDYMCGMANGLILAFHTMRGVPGVPPYRSLRRKDQTDG